MITPYKTRVRRLSKRLCDDIAAYFRGSDIPCSWRLQVAGTRDRKDLNILLVTFITREDGDLLSLVYRINRKFYTLSEAKTACAGRIGNLFVVTVKEYLAKEIEKMESENDR